MRTYSTCDPHQSDEKFKMTTFHVLEFILMNTLREDIYLYFRTFQKNYVYKSICYYNQTTV